MLNVNAHHIQIVGQSLMLECILTTVQGISSAVNFAWWSNGAVLKKEENFSKNYTTQNLDVYSSTYTISPLSTTDDDRTYHCEVFVGSTPPIIALDSVTLDVSGMSLS